MPKQPTGPRSAAPSNRLKAVTGYRERQIARLQVEIEELKKDHELALSRLRRELATEIETRKKTERKLLMIVKIATVEN